MNAVQVHVNFDLVDSLQNVCTRFVLVSKIHSSSAVYSALRCIFFFEMTIYIYFFFLNERKEHILQSSISVLSEVISSLGKQHETLSVLHSIWCKILDS